VPVSQTAVMGNYAITYNYFIEMSYNASISMKLESQKESNMYKHWSGISHP